VERRYIPLHKRFIPWKEVSYEICQILEVKTKKPKINIFKIGGSYYFKHFFEDKELFIGDMLSDRKIV